MERLKKELEALDEALFVLEDKIGLDGGERRELLKKQAEALKLSRAREANVMAVAQKVASRLDQAIQHVEHIIRH